MERVINEIENLKRVIRGSRPNVKYTQIMNQIGVLEREILNLLPKEEFGGYDEVVEEFGEEVVEEVIEEVSPFSNYEDLSLSELREIFTDIKATSKEAFLLKINNLPK
jgi:flagellar motor switch protein FliG